ncbi:MAG TPA: sel1 repeat family protein [Thioploca sp.]|nr:MAG: hypothetical protein DRR08_09140 [Gammaproteobacteria bacterium]HDN26502.1 sel1 repeat family protein [Thioploca sp.]
MATDKKHANEQTAEMSAEVQELLLTAQQGDVEAQFQLGKAYEVGEGVARPDGQAAADWFRQAAEQGHIQAQFYLYLLLSMGYFELEKNDEEAIYWLHKVADQGYAEAQIELARAYKRGNGVEPDDEQAIYWLRQAAEQEDVVTELTPISSFSDLSPQNDARRELAKLYERGEGVGKDYEQAIFWYQKAAEHGSDHAKDRLESLQRKTQYITEYRQAAEQGDAQAQFGLGWEYRNGQFYSEDSEKAVYWFQKAAEQGHIEAQFGLAVAYEKGQGVAQDSEKAVYWYRQIAEREFDETPFELHKRDNETQESYERRVEHTRQRLKETHTKAQFYLGCAYSDGKGVIPNDEQAIYWYRQAAENGQKRAQFYLGCAYSDGQGVPQDDEQAVYWYQKAAQDTDRYREGDRLEEGDIDAVFNLAYAYEKGEGIPQDDGKAVYWYQKVANKGDTEAQFELGKIYDKAILIQDYEEVVSWYRSLRVNEHEDAYQQSHVGEQLDKREARDSQDLGRKWYQKQVVYECQKTATDWYRQAAEHGYSKALLYLGVQTTTDNDAEALNWLCQLAVNPILEGDEYEGELSETEDDKAIASLREKAEQEISVAQTVLAYLCKTGNGVSQDQQQAFFWFEKAAQLEDIVAQYWLGSLYFEARKFERAKEYFQQVSQNRHHGYYDELDMAKIESLAKDQLLVLQGIELEIKNHKELENVMAMFADKLTGPLQRIEYLEKDERLLEDVRLMGSMLNIFSLVSSNAKKLRDNLLQDRAGEGTLLSVLEQALSISVAAMLTLNNRDKIRQHYLNYAKRTEQVPVTTTRKQWKSNHLELELQLQADWQRSFMDISNAPRLENLSSWLTERFFPIEVQGFAEAPIHFERYGATESTLLVIISEIFTNALKYYASQTQQTVLLRWKCDTHRCKFVCANPTSYKEQSIGKGNGKGHQFLPIIARQLGGEFPLPPFVKNYAVEFKIPTHLLKEEFPKQESKL